MGTKYDRLGKNPVMIFQITIPPTFYLLIVRAGAVKAAASEGHDKVIEVLLEAKADVLGEG